MRDERQTTNERTNEQTLKIELLSQWKLEAEFRNLSAAKIIFCTFVIYPPDTPKARARFLNRKVDHQFN